jgi:hypothetical protein
VFLLRLDNRDIQAAATSPQDRSHRDTGGAAADDKNLMMLLVRHWLFLPDLFLSARAALNRAGAMVDGAINSQHICKMQYVFEANSERTEKSGDFRCLPFGPMSSWL